MPSPDAAPEPRAIEAWLSELGVEPGPGIERDGIVSWDLVLDGRRRFDIRVTLILEPALACIAWVHYAPPLNDGFRRSYRRLLRWNDEFPFAKFAIATDERPVLAVEIPIEHLSADELGLALARLIGLCDRLVDESADWIWLDGKVPPAGERRSRHERLLGRYADRLPELLGS